MTSYNYSNGYSLLSYLEYPIILVQEYILIFFVLKYLSKINMWSFLCAIIYFALSSCLLLGIVPKVILTLLAVGLNIANNSSIALKHSLHIFELLANVYADLSFQ